ncbi:D-alanine--poly(phosphoribitol) ligase subunit DltA [Furfurilactobacillus milii]|uniref:D-alanine--D-alanyl carrier protein ligase n=1 Tax=Furfurilactobacillus milii TaxID=2888272 RepID=A0A6N9I6V2_9LACO|nr:D-alanine--poly(phosphoribitol) ligase subunit DltA [Furfurilactobacillus milii]MYV18003.1 D-alanine--poly(phosphoribitol) ligase subunit DltA [Furfurilactobacillus milii]
MIDNMITTIDNWAATTPDAIVYNDMGETHTYAQLKRASDAIAAYLDGLNLPAKSPIIVFGGQQFAMIASFLGAVKAGHAYIPVDKHSPNDRLTMIEDIAHPSAVIAVDALPVDVGEQPVLTGDTLSDLFSAQTATYQLDHPVDGDDNYYIIFTSGTTGKPKGVQISHTNLLSYTNWMLSDDFKLSQNPVTLAQPPYSFDLSVMDWAPTLALGGTLMALPKQVTDNFKQLFETLPTMNLNVFVSTPSFADICLLEPTFDEQHLPDLSHFLFCGEELTVSTAKNLRTRFPHAHIFNTYGPTETTVAVTGVEITDALIEKGRLPIGTVKSDTQIRIVDDENKSLPAGTNGEIVISGPSVSKGYLNNPEKTEKAFFTEDGRSAYHSGDLGFLDEDGMLHYLGRIDFQIKLHGYRIELEEVNHYLDANKWIKQAVAVPKYDNNHKVSQMWAYVVPNSKDDFKNDLQRTTAIKQELKDVMMDYMVPNRFVYKDSLPLTANGKVDIKSIIAEVNPA